MTGKRSCLPSFFAASTSDSGSIRSAPSSKKRQAHAKRLRETSEQHNKRIREVTEGLNEESDVAHLEAFFDQISQLSDFIKKEKQDKEEKKIKEKEKKEEKKKNTEEKKKGEEKENNPSEPKRSITSWLDSKNLLKLKDVLYEAISAAKDFTSSGDAEKMARGLIRDIGGGHAFNIIFIVVADVWQRYVDMSDDEKECLSLLEEINEFAKYVIYLKKVLQNGPASKKMLEDAVKKAIELIIETSIACCTHIEASKISRYGKRTEYGAELAKYVKKLKKAYARIPLPMCIGIFEEVLRLRLPECSKDAVGTEKPMQLRKPDYPEYPEDAVETNKPVQLRKPDYPECSKDAVGTKKPVQLRKPDYPEYPKDASKSSSTPSSSRLPKESDYADTIMEAAKEVDKENVDGDFSDLINYISLLLDFIKHGGEKPSPVSTAKYDWPDSISLIKLKEVMSGAAETAKDLCPDAKTIAHRALQGMGGLQMLATGFLVVGNLMERYETVLFNREEYLCLLERMNNLIQEVKQLKERPRLMEAMEAKIKEAMELIIEVSLACCTQIDRPKYKKFFSTNVNTKELQRYQTRLTELNRKIQLQIEFVVHNLLLKVPLCLPASEKFRRENRVQIEKVTELLEWESKERAVAVILYGLGGTGKTTLADAVYWSLYHEKVLPFSHHEEVRESKYSYVRLFESINLVPHIPKLQTQVLQDLTSRTADIRRYEDGRHAIKEVLEKEVVFIYIDNVLFPYKVEQGLNAIEELLPRTTKKVKKLRLLITTRDKGAAVEACKRLRITTELYPIETLEDTKAMQLVKEELNDGEEDLVNEQLNGRDEKLDSNQINQIVQICGGIPRVLKEVAAYIGFSQNREEAQRRYHQVISERENNWNGRIGWNNIARRAFAHEHLDEKLKDPFFDICSYFQGWDWEELSNIVGDFELNSLEDRALVTKDVNSMTAKVHNVILAIGIHNKGRRFKFTSASEFQKVLNPKKDKDLCGIKGIWSNDYDNIGPLDIPAPKLDLMCGSLRVLALENSAEVKGRCNGTFEELCFFSAKISHIPFDLSKVKTLRHLCYSTDDLQNLCQMPRNLTSNLRMLQLRQCGSIESLPESIGQFNFLDSIDLSSTDLKELPNGFCSLSSLKNLAMDNCQSLEKLPDGFGKLRSLRKLSLSRCVNLKKLPHSFSQLKDLEALNLSGCVNLVQLCIDFKELSSLRVLSLKDCKMLKNLPENFHGLSSLKHLYLSNCVELEVRSMESIVKMETLQTVDIQSSPLLQKAWQNIKEGCNQLSHKVVRTSGQGSSNEENVERNDDMQE